MLKQQVVETSLGAVTVASLTLGELRRLEALMQQQSQQTAGGIENLVRYLPVIAGSVAKSHPELTVDRLESALTLEDFEALFNAVLEVSGLKKAPPGEFIPVAV